MNEILEFFPSFFDTSLRCFDDFCSFGDFPNLLVDDEFDYPTFVDCDDHYELKIRLSNGDIDLSNVNVSIDDEKYIKVISRIQDGNSKIIYSTKLSIPEYTEPSSLSANFDNGYLTLSINKKDYDAKC